jgi:transcriptional regulator with XRE-family HTH domain
MKALPTAKLKNRPIDPVAVLRAALDQRCRKNPRYSIRSFSRDSGISVTVLSLVLSGKRKLSKKATMKLADFLNLGPTETAAMISYDSPVPQAQFQKMDLDRFSVISDWYHYAILSALELPDSQLEQQWISKQLGISVLEAKLAIERLKSLGLLEQNDEGRWQQSGNPIKIENSESTIATRKFHKQLLHKASESIDKDPISDRDFSSMTFAMDPSLVEYARRRIQTFRRQLTTELESKGNPGAVFQMNVQLFPFTPIKKET